MSRRKKALSSDSSEYDSDSDSNIDWDVVPSDNDADWSEREYDEFQYDSEDNYPDPLDDPVKRAEWFDSVKSEFNGDEARFVQGQIKNTVNTRFEFGLSVRSQCGLSLDMGLLKFSGFDNKEAMSTRLGDFYESNVLQKEYVYRMGLDVKPENLNIKGNYVGYKVDLMKLSGIMLKNESLLKSVVAEQKFIDDTPFTEYNSEVTCNTERRNRLLGKLRFIIGIEKYDLFKVNYANRKYFLFYVCFMNIPFEERLKRQDAHLFCIASESKLIQNCLTVQDVVRSIADELKVLEVDGVDVEFLNDGDELPELINVKGVLAAIHPTKISMYEIIGHRQPRPKAFNCHFCGATESHIQDFHNCLPLLGASEADDKGYDQCVQAILNYEQKKRDKMKIIDEDDDDFQYPPKPIKIVQSAKVYKNRFDVHRGCPLTDLSGVNLWNISPPNVLVDIADGVIGPLMSDLILVHAIKGLSGGEIATKISGFEFAAGRIEVRFGNGAFSWSKAVKTVQKLELLSRLGDIFANNLNVAHKGYELLETLQSFTKLALSFTIPIDDIPKLHLFARTLIQLCLDLNPTFKVFPKLHELLHYSDLTQLYGPLIYFSPLKNYKNELLFYRYSYVLRRCTSVTLTHLSRRQMVTALQLNKQKYLSVDLFANSNVQFKNGYDLVLQLEVDRLKKIEEKKKKKKKEKEEDEYADEGDDGDDESEGLSDSHDDYIG